MEKKTGDFYTGVRNRGMLNQMLTGPALAYQDKYPDRKCKWEHMPPSGDTSMIVMREAQGWKLAKAEELGEQTESAQREGLIRRGDLVLMWTDPETFQALRDADAQAADEDYRMPETTYKEAMENKEFQLKSGETQKGRAFGRIKRTTEEAGETLQVDESQSKLVRT